MNTPDLLKFKNPNDELKIEEDRVFETRSCKEKINTFITSLVLKA